MSRVVYEVDNHVFYIQNFSTECILKVRQS
jgi:hypothetical protein